MFSRVLKRPFAAARRDLMQLALPLAMFVALLALGGDRGYLYRAYDNHGKNTIKTLAIVENLSPEHNFLLARSIRRDEDGSFLYNPYGRFPIGGFALLKVILLPFGNDIAAKLTAARVLSLLMFCGAALFAFLAMSRITGSRRVALAATLIAFSGFYAIYHADEVSNESVMDLFGAALTFHGMTVFVQEGRFRQLLVKTCAALLLGWHVYALLLPFIALGLGGEAVALLRSAAAAPPREMAKAARSAIISLARSRYAALAAVSILFGSALLAVNFANEYAALRGDVALSELPSASSALARAGISDVYAEVTFLGWGGFIRQQLYRVGAASVPYSAARAVGYDFPTPEPRETALAPAVWGLAATCAALASLKFARRRRVLAASAILFGFCWAIPMRYTAADPEHYLEAVHYLWLPLALFALALVGARRLLGERAGERLALGICAAAALAFASSVFLAGRIDRDAADAERQKTAMADYSAIMESARGKTVAFYPDPVSYLWTERAVLDETMLLYYYLAGSYARTENDCLRAGDADFTVSPHRFESPGLLTPENGGAFLRSPPEGAELCRAERRRLESSPPAARSVFDVYLDGDRLAYLKAPCEPRDYETQFYAYLYPRDPDILTAERRRHGFHWLLQTVTVADKGAVFDDACLMSLRLPDFPTAAIRTGQRLPGVENLWEVLAAPPLDDDALAFYENAYQAIASSGEPTARAGFDLYLEDDALSYLKEPCGDGDARGRFFLSVHPADVADLPEDRREIGHESLNFTFAPPAGVIFDGKCMATRQLPDYPIAEIKTGQWIPGGERLWDAEMAVGD